MSAAAEAWRAYKPRSFELLALEAGDHVLDVGCGTGEDACALAGLWPGVAVLGIDASETKIAEALARTLGIPRPVEFRVGDAHRLDFEDATFDACRADKVFHHLDEPGKAFAEMVRVARPGGRVVVSDADYETLVVDAPDRALTRRILNGFCDGLPHGWLGRRLPGFYADAGLAEIAVVPATAVVLSYDEDVLHLAEKAEDACRAGVIAPAEAARWRAGLAEADRAGRFFCAVTVFTVSGRKP